MFHRLARAERLWTFLLARPGADRPAPRRLGLEPLEDRVVPARPLPFPVVAAGAGEGGPGVVRLFAGDTGEEVLLVAPYEPTMTAGVRVATGDLTGDGYPDLVTAPGTGGGPRVRAFDGKTGVQLPAPLGNFFAYDPSMTAGLQLAVGDVTGDGVPDIVTAADTGGGPHIKVFDGTTGQEVRSFFAYEPEFTGGVRIAVGDIANTGRADIIVGAGKGGGPRIRVLDPDTLKPIDNPLGDFFAFDPNDRDGVYVAAGSVLSGPGRVDLVAGSGSRRDSRFRVFGNGTWTVDWDQSVFGGSQPGGVQVGTAYLDDDDHADVVVSPGPGAGVAPVVQALSGATRQPVEGAFAGFDPGVGSASGGANVSAGDAPAEFGISVQSLVPGATIIAAGSPVRVQASTRTGGNVQSFDSTLTWSPGGQTDSWTVTLPTPGQVAEAVRSWVPPPAPPPPPGPSGPSAVVAQIVASLTTAAYDTVYDRKRQVDTAAVAAAIEAVALPPARPSRRGSDGSAVGGTSKGGVRYGPGTYVRGRNDTINMIYYEDPNDTGPFVTTLPAPVPSVLDRRPVSALFGAANSLDDPAVAGLGATYTSDKGYAVGSPVGGGFSIDPGFSKAGPAEIRVTVGDRTVTLDGVGAANDKGFYPTYTPRFGEAVSASYDKGFFQLVAADGTVVDFQADDDPARPAPGAVVRSTTRGGAVTEVVAWDPLGRPTATRRSEVVDGRPVVGWLNREYLPETSPNAGKLRRQRALLSVDNQPAEALRTLEYQYYSPGDPGGRVGDLRSEVVTDALNRVIGRTYYRYYTADTFDSGGQLLGKAGQMRLALTADGFERATAALGGEAGVRTASDDQLLPFTDAVLKYDPLGRVRALTTAGQDTTTFQYTVSGNPTGARNWATKTVETESTGAKTTVYTNDLDLPILKIVEDALGNKRACFSRYNANGQLIFQADPSAVTGYDEALPELVGTNGNDSYLSATAGLVGSYTYGGTTTATPTTAGDVAGLLQSFVVRQGTAGPAVPQLARTYYLPTANVADAAPATQTVYGGADGTVPRTTNYVYEWFAGTGTVKSVTTLGPAVSAADNGSGLADAFTKVFDAAGRLRWTRDSAGSLTYRGYDAATGGLSVYIDDVDTTRTGDFADLPSGWATPGGGGLHRTDATERDLFGRVTKYTGPGGRVDYVTYDDARRETRLYNAWDAALNRPTGPTVIVRENRARGTVDTILHAGWVPTSGGRPTADDMVYNVVGLTRVRSDAAGRTTSVDEYAVQGLSYSEDDIGPEGVYFLRTRFATDARGRLVRVQTPGGTVTRTTYDSLDRPTGAWVGTDDAVAGGWAPENPGDLVPVSSVGYDALGRVAESVDKPGVGRPDAVTRFVYDWRNRLAGMKAGAEASESAAVNRPLTLWDYDNLGNPTATRVYDGDGVALATAGGAAVAPAGSLLRAREEAQYDALGRAFRVKTYPVGAGGALGTPDVTEAWYDGRSLPVKVTAPGGAAVKATYDGLGRAVASYLTDGGGDAGYADAAGLAGDTVWAQDETGYDAAGYVVQTTSRERAHGAAGAGPLGTPASGVPARVTYAGYYYDAAGRPVATVDVGTNGGAAWTRPAAVPAASDTALVSTVAYGITGRPQWFTDPAGVTDSVSDDALGRPTEWRSAVGTPVEQVTTAAYDTQGRLASVTEPGNRTTAYLYDAWDRPVGATERAGTPLARTSTSALDRIGQVLSETDPLGTVTTTALDVLGRTVGATEAAGTPLARSSAVAYDTLDRVTAETDPRGFVTATAYDDPARSVTTTNPLGQSVTAAYDAAGNLASLTDRAGHATTAAYDLTGRPVGVTDALGHTTSFEYNVSGDRDRVVDPLGRASVAVYDQLGRTQSEADPLGRTTAYGYDRSGRTTTVTDPRGTVYATAYDALGRVTAQTDAVGQPEQRSQSWAYTPAGDLDHAVDPRGVVTQYAYDSAGRATGVTAAAGLPEALTVTTAYDLLDRPTSVTMPGNRTTATAYDALGQATSVTEGVGTALARATTFEYDAAGNQTKVTAPLNRVTQTAYDKLGRPVSVTDAVGAVTATAYDAAGRTASVTDPVGNVTSWTYDAADRVTAETDPLGKSTLYGYDAAGQLVSMTARDGRRKGFTFDAAGQVTQEQWYSAANSLLQTQTFGYDANGNLTSASNPAGTYTLAYDRLDRPTNVSEPFGVGLAMTYDAAGNRLTLADSFGGVQTSGYDGLGRLTSREWSGAGVSPARAKWGYDAAGDAATLTRSSKSAGGAWQVAGVTATAHDSLGRVASITTQSGSGGTVGAYSYAYDAADRVTAETVNGATRSYAYDAAGQLTSDGGSGITYDAAGNRTSGGSVVGPGNRLVSDGTWTYTYDDEGRVTKRSRGASAETWTYQYDLNGQMTSAAKSATDGGAATETVSYAFDALGNRVERADAVGGGPVSVERFAYDGWDTAKPGAVGSENFDAVLDLDGSNALTTRRMFGAGRDNPVGRQAAGGSGGTTWYDADRLGSVRAVFSDAGSVTGTRDYAGFGAVTTQAGAGLDRYGFTAREWDASLKLQYNRARMYDPQPGRWLSEDPVGLAAGDSNINRYVGNGPTGATDPSGLIYNMNQTSSKPVAHDMLYRPNEHTSAGPVVRDMLYREKEHISDRRPVVANMGTEPTQSTNPDRKYNIDEVMAYLSINHPDVYKWIIDNGIKIEDLDRSRVGRWVNGRAESGTESGALVIRLWEGFDAKAAAEKILELTQSSFWHDEIWNSFTKWQIGEIEAGRKSPDAYIKNYLSQVIGTTVNGANIAMAFYTIFSNGAGAADLVIRLSEGDVHTLDLAALLPIVGKLGASGRVLLQSGSKVRITSVAEIRILAAFDSLMTEAGRLGGKLVPRERLKKLAEEVNTLFKVGVREALPLEVNKLAGKERAKFRVYIDDAGKPTHAMIYYKADVTFYELQHELFHMLHAKRIGYEKYVKLTPLEREQEVFDRFIASPIWKKLTPQERLDAADYLKWTYRGNTRGLPHSPVDPRAP